MLHLSLYGFQNQNDIIFLLFIVFDKVYMISIHQRINDFETDENVINVLYCT